MTEYGRTDLDLELTRPVDQAWSSRRRLPAACVAVALTVVPIGPLAYGHGPAQDSTAVAPAPAVDLIYAWLALALEDGQPKEQCWFIDADGTWTLRQPAEPIAIVVARREAATPERAARLVLGPVLMSGALRPAANDAAPARKTALIRQVLGLSFA